MSISLSLSLLLTLYFFLASFVSGTGEAVGCKQLIWNCGLGPYVHAFDIDSISFFPLALPFC